MDLFEYIEPETLDRTTKQIGDIGHKFDRQKQANNVKLAPSRSIVLIEQQDR